MFRPENDGTLGFAIADADDTILPENRGNLFRKWVTVAREDNLGYQNWRVYRPGDLANMSWWPFDPAGVPPNGAISGSYSFAFPSRKLANGKYRPLQNPSTPDPRHLEQDAVLAGPNDYLIVSTSGHGERIKMAFGGSPPLIAHHRGNNPPALSSIVHDVRGDSPDQIRKAGLHTAWEVREWVAPGSGMSSAGPRLWSIAWVADSAPDGTGFARIGFGDSDGLFSHMQSGPFIPSLREKHLLSVTADGPMIAGAISTNAYFRGSGNPYSAPLDFEEKPYPSVREGHYPYRVFLWYDENRKHSFKLGDRDGLWRWFVKLPITETPKCTPTKDYSTVDTNSNPRRTFAEDSRIFMPKKLISNGIYFQPRVNLTMGRKPDPESPIREDL